jgi:hypothetical protein
VEKIEVYKVPHCFQENNGFFKTVWNFVYFNFFHCEPWLDKVAIEIELGNMDNLIESSYENWF